jgi:hypothetical protein
MEVVRKSQQLSLSPCGSISNGLSRRAGPSAHLPAGRRFGGNVGCGKSEKRRQLKFSDDSFFRK